MKFIRFKRIKQDKGLLKKQLLYVILKTCSVKVRLPGRVVKMRVTHKMKVYVVSLYNDVICFGCLFVCLFLFYFVFFFVLFCFVCLFVVSLNRTFLCEDMFIWILSVVLKSVKWRNWLPKLSSWIIYLQKSSRIPHLWVQPWVRNVYSTFQISDTLKTIILQKSHTWKKNHDFFVVAVLHFVVVVLQFQTPPRSISF